MFVQFIKIEYVLRNIRHFKLQLNIEYFESYFTNELTKKIVLLVAWFGYVVMMWWGWEKCSRIQWNSNIEMQNDITIAKGVCPIIS